MELKFKIKNVGGIKYLEKTFNFSEKTTKLIYAPNGTGKTSFSKAIVKFNNEKDKKSFSPNKITKEKIDIKIENTKTNLMNITVFDSFEKYKLKYGEDIFEASQKKETELIKQILDLEKIIEKNKNLKRIKDLYSLNANEKKDLKLTNNKLINDLSFSVAENIINIYRNEEKNILDKNLYNFLEKNLEDLFSSKVLLKIISKFSKILKITKSKKDYKKEKTNLPVEYSLNTLSETNKFLQNNKDLITKMMIASSNNDDVLIKIIDKINNFHLNEFSKLSFFKDNLKFKTKTEEKFSFVLEELIEYIEIKNVEDYFKIKDFAIMSIIKQENESIINEIEEKIVNCKKLMPNIEDQEKEWKEVKSIYESIFNTKVIFELQKEKNKTTGEDSYCVYLSHRFQKEKITEKVLRENLSESELRQLYIFDIMHKLNYMINNSNENEENLVVFDDIVDSFDQRNMTALISYFKYLETLNTNIKFIFLTHNYTFFNQMNKKIFLSDSFIMRQNNKENYISEINIDDYIFLSWNDPSTINNKKIQIIGTLLLTREYQTKNCIYNKDISLVDFFHIKEKTKKLKLKELYQKIEETSGLNLEFKLNKNENYLDFIYESCQNIVDLLDSFELKKDLINSVILSIQNGSLEDVREKLKKLDSIKMKSKTKRFIDSLIKMKTNSINPFESLIPKLRKEMIFKTEDISEEVLKKACLSLGIRLKLEEFIINNSDVNLELNKVNKDQTSYLLNKDQELTKKYNLRKYEIATSNIIHLNSLNYEPLFYYDYEELKMLYKEISSL